MNWEDEQNQNLPYVINGSIPILEVLNNDYRIYELGYSLGEFIVDGWKYTGLIRLIKSNGNTLSALEITQADSEKEWISFLKLKYNL